MGKDIWWESTPVLRIAHFQTSLVQIWCTVQLHSLWICHRWKFGQVWGSPLPSSPIRHHRKSPVPKSPGPSTITWKNRNHSAMQPLGCMLVTGRYVLGVLYGENKPKSENCATLMPRSSATVRNREKLTGLGNFLALGLQRGVNSISLQCIPWPVACSEWGACLTDSRFQILGANDP